jgi:hypothetical protein
VSSVGDCASEAGCDCFELRANAEAWNAHFRLMDTRRYSRVFPSMSCKFFHLDTTGDRFENIGTQLGPHLPPSPPKKEPST